MLPFRPVELDDRARMEKILFAKNYRITEASFIDLYIWRDRYGSAVCFQDGFMFLRFSEGGDVVHMCPIGDGDLAEAVHTLEAHCAKRGEALKLTCVTDEMRAELEAALPGHFDFAENRDMADYIYLSENLITLGGKKLHAKRNFLNRFKRLYDGRWSFDAIDPSDLSDIYAFECRWFRKNESSPEDRDSENTAIRRLLEHMEALGSAGGVLTVDGEIVGFSCGTPLSHDTFGIQIEKADWDIPGAYQALNQLFAERYCKDYTYINREDDLGLEGLRQAKLSYHPHEIKMKYDAEPRVKLRAPRPVQTGVSCCCD